MEIGVPSRFACLKIEDDDFRSFSQPKKKADKQNKKISSAGKEAPKNSSTVVSKKGGSEKTKNNGPKKPKQKQKQGQEAAWEEWQKKDAKLISEDFEQQMHHAILQSKLDFEHQKKITINKSEPEPSHAKKKKGKTMSLDQFLDNSKENEIKEEAVDEDDSKFFNDVSQVIKKEITKEIVEENRKKRQEVFEKELSLAKCQEKLEAEIVKNRSLEKELVDAKKEIALVKKRNTTLCSMLSQGEMKEKAEVILELEKLTAVKEELTEEVARLHKLLEQERSNKGGTNNDIHAKHETHAKHGKEKIKKKNR